ncbi:hypothetical protein B0F74_25035, partial [Rhodococcus hoagii]|nr:hypothetical protein [Prescottella equi]
TAPQGYLAGLGFTLEDLTDRLGIDPAAASEALTAVDEDAVMLIAERAVGWQGGALLDLATGTSIDDIRIKYGLSDAAVDENLDEDEQILKALEQPASKMQFAFIEDNDELRRAIESDD